MRLGWVVHRFDRAMRALAALGPGAPRAGPVGGDAPGADDLVTIVRSTGDHERLDASGLAGLLLAYHLQTEAEKGVPVPGVAGLPEPYRREVEDPRDAFRGQSVLVASTGSQAVGCVVLTAPQDGRCEIKRLWTDPSCRGRGVASSLVDAALAEAAAAGAATVELTVWRWRTAAIAWYERLGFARCAPRDDRAGLVCMQRKGFA